MVMDASKTARTDVYIEHGRESLAELRKKESDALALSPGWRAYRRDRGFIGLDAVEDRNRLVQ